MRPATRAGRALWWAALLLAVPAAGVLAAHPLAAVAVIGSVWLFTVVRSTGRHVKGRPNQRKGGSWSPPSHVHLIDTSDHRAGR